MTPSAIRNGAIALLLVSSTSCGTTAAQVTDPLESPSRATRTERSGGLELRPLEVQSLQRVIADSGGRVVLVNVWATWCVPCIEELPDLVRFYRAHADQGVRLVLISGDFPSQSPGVTAFLRELGVDFPTWIKRGDDMSFIDALDPSWSGSLPATFVFTPAGQRLHSHDGVLDLPALTALVDRALTPPGAQDQ